MKKIFFLLFTLITVGACSPKKIVEVKPLEKLPKPITTKVDSISYSFGLSIAETFLKIQEDTDGEIKLDVDLFSEAIKEKLSNNSRLTEDELQKTMMNFSQEMAQLEQAKNEKDAMEAKEKGLQFLADNAKKEGVKTTDSGLQYLVLKEGSGNAPIASNEVKVHYTGKLIDGSVFDSSVERGQPASFVLNQVIPGWTEGLQLMKPGAKYEFTIPSELGYGLRGSPPVIPGGAVLIFEVELLEVMN